MPGLFQPMHQQDAWRHSPDFQVVLASLERDLQIPVDPPSHYKVGHMPGSLVWEVISMR